MDKQQVFNNYLHHAQVTFTCMNEVYMVFLRKIHKRQQENNSNILDDIWLELSWKI
jgi:hypothetical protein